MFFILEETKEAILDFSQGTVRVLWIYFALLWYQYKMTQFNILNVKWSNSRLKELKSAVKGETSLTLRLSSNMVGESDDENKFSHKLLLTERQVSKFRKDFANNLSPNT